MKGYRDTWAEVSLAAIEGNATQFRGHIQPDTKLMAVIKADGYGHGAVETAKAALRGGADYLAVAIVDEGLALREAGIAAPILVLGYTPVRSVATALAGGLTLTVFDEAVLDEIIRLGEAARIHLKVDTGMSRIGVASTEEALHLAERAAAATFVQLEGIFTHFAHADGEDPAYTYEQFHKFLAVAEALERQGIQIPLKHCCNSAATMRFPEMHLDMVRVGIALYGLYPDASLRETVPLTPAMSLKTKVAAVKTVPAGRPVSYGCTSVLNQERRIATLPIGYADGLSRLLSNRGEMLLHGGLVPIAGRVCMDQTMIDVTASACEAGDTVTVFGQDRSAVQSVDQLAAWMGTINYEVVCLIGKRVPRVYNT
ncbi:alanine racemase [Ectobacillus ponti]|uniref:Alanine racemase n=1 Tax=Ectobacillus ponti TaxID=2961894 RepID=A0AA42BSF1_9BACI|nr:alanine racemase [Ectobacillus ponti]MCP8971321.1 alanine racemase [Ectobacillus ponti]